jgi:hypothetical protein
VNPVRELDTANPHIQFDEREMETNLRFAGIAIVFSTFYIAFMHADTKANIRHRGER